MPTEEGKMNINELGRIYEIFADVKYIRMTLEDLAKTVNGNGKPGLKQDVHDIQNWHKENDDDIKRVIRLNSSQNYLKRGAWEVVRWLGSGTVIYGFLHILSLIK